MISYNRNKKLAVFKNNYYGRNSANMKKDIIFKVIYMSIMLIVLFSSITFAKDENDTIEETMDSNMLLTNEQGIDV